MSVRFNAPKEKDCKNYVKFAVKNSDAIITVYVRPSLGFNSEKPLNITLNQEGGES